MDDQLVDSIVQSVATIGSAGFTLYMLVRVVTASLVRVIQVQNERSEYDGDRITREAARADRAETRHDECLQLVAQLRTEVDDLKRQVAANAGQMRADANRIRQLEGVVDRRHLNEPYSGEDRRLPPDVTD